MRGEEGKGQESSLVFTAGLMTALGMGLVMVILGAALMSKACRGQGQDYQQIHRMNFVQIGLF